MAERTQTEGRMLSKRAEELVAELAREHGSYEGLFGPDGVIPSLTKRLLEQALEGEMTHHLGYDRHEAAGRGSGNSRNGHLSKTVQSETATMEIQVPRDRNGSFEPVLVPKRKRRIGQLDNVILSLYSRGLTQAQIKEHIREIYQVDLSKELISTITDTVMDDVRAWQNRPLNEVYPIVYLDAVVLRGRVGKQVIRRVVYVVVGVDITGHKDVLGFWFCESEGAKFWLSVLNDLKNRGVRDILIACVDGLKGFPEAIQAAFPRTTVQLCIVHLIRSSTQQVAWKERKAVTGDLKPIYTATTAEAAALALDEFERIWGERYPMVARAWRSVWAYVIPFFDFAPDIRRAIYTTNAIESIHSSLRHITDNRALFPNDDAILKLLFLALTHASAKWTMPIPNWKPALQQLAIHFEGRVPLNSNSHLHS
jgi:putative transposase